MACASGWTALMAAAARGCKSAVRTLPAAGVDAGLEGCTGRTALTWARAGGREAVAELLKGRSAGGRECVAVCCGFGAREPSCCDQNGGAEGCTAVD